ncbi:unnamed protein product [Rotaria sp. Silwood1]|nr:unnamed protein product [Rotaria sp. Silwood1]CAF5093672.1 unnamed protein product [Rotaria sp. Silwood1]
MENKNSNKRNSTLDSFVISSKKPREEDISLNFNPNQSFSSSSSTNTNILTISSPPDHSLTDVLMANATNSSLNIEDPPPKSSSTVYPADLSQTNQNLPSQPRLAAYPIDKKNRGFDRYVKSQTHIISSANFLEYQSRQKSNTSVINVLEKSTAEQILYNRNKLIKISAAILLCAKQLIALRGHDESINSNNRGNLVEILNWSAKTDPLARAMLEESAGDGTCLSHQIQNELLNIMAKQIRDKIAGKNVN